MRALISYAALVVQITLPLAGCQEHSPLPADFRMEVIDPSTATSQADTIVLAYPVQVKDNRPLIISSPNRNGISALEEMEVTLHNVLVVKGRDLPTQIQFRYYDARGSLQVGAPQGPAGKLNTLGIFFLLRLSDGTFRSAVDVYRPDISTPWLQGAPRSLSCEKAPECVAKILLTFEQPDEPEAFASSLLRNVAISRQLAGFLNTFDLLKGLAIAKAQPDEVRRTACVELSKWYSLELPLQCNEVIIDNSGWQDCLSVVGKLRERLKTAGVAWINSRIGSDSQNDTKRYLEILRAVPDPGTRASAERLLKELQ